MAGTKVAQVWNVLVTAFVRFLAKLGFAAPAATTTRQRPMCENTAASALPRTSDPQDGRSVPPTMKQRILAEAHGTSPASGSLPRWFINALRTDPACDTVDEIWTACPRDNTFCLA
jgi:hypothetical protein